MMTMEFLEAETKSHFIFQFKCKGCRNTWWGTVHKNTCRMCQAIVERLPLAQMTGIGWFRCHCSRVYAGFSAGNVTSKCHGCNKENLPLFIVPGDDAAKPDGSRRQHYCNACKGKTPCPIVNRARNIGGRGRRRFS